MCSSDLRLRERGLPGGHGGLHGEAAPGLQGRLTAKPAWRSRAAVNSDCIFASSAGFIVASAIVGRLAELGWDDVLLLEESLSESKFVNLLQQMTKDACHFPGNDLVSYEQTKRSCAHTTKTVWLLSLNATGGLHASCSTNSITSKESFTSTVCVLNMRLSQPRPS